MFLISHAGMQRAVIRRVLCYLVSVQSALKWLFVNATAGTQFAGARLGPEEVAEHTLRVLRRFVILVRVIKCVLSHACHLPGFYELASSVSFTAGTTAAAADLQSYATNVVCFYPLFVYSARGSS